MSRFASLSLPVISLANSRVPSFLRHSRYAPRARIFISILENCRKHRTNETSIFYAARRKNLQANEYIYIYIYIYICIFSLSLSLSLHFLFKLPTFSSSSSSLHLGVHAARSTEKSSRNSFLKQLFPALPFFSFSK